MVVASTRLNFVGSGRKGYWGAEGVAQVYAEGANTDNVYLKLYRRIVLGLREYHIFIP